MAKETKTEQGLQELVQQEVAKAATNMVQQISAQLQAKGTGLNLLAPAFIAAVAASKDPLKNATNPHLKNTYADLGSVLDAVRDAFLSNGLWLIQSPGEITDRADGPYLALHGLLLHSSGQSIQFKMELPAFTISKSGGRVLNPQTAGSATSYARRYMWLAVAGLWQVDDDGDEASYDDGSQGPSQSASVASRAAELNEGDTWIGKLKATANMDELKLLRAGAQEAAKRLGDKRITDTYLDMRTQHGGGS